MPGLNSCLSERNEAEHGSTDVLEPTIETIAPNLWLTHDAVVLGPLRADLAETYWRWENSLPVMAGYARPDDLRPEITLEGVSPVRELFGIDQPKRPTHRGNK